MRRDGAGMPSHRIALGHPADWDGFRSAARAHLVAGTAPAQLQWAVTGQAEADLFAGAADVQSPESPESPEHRDRPALPKYDEALAPDAPPRTVQVPREVFALCERAVLHRDPERFALMYRLLWRMQQDPLLRHDALDADRVRLTRMASAVRRDMHKMRAFVRFRPVVDGSGEPWHVAWFEPDHFITEANARFFVQRFTQMRWAIITPDCSLRWDGVTLETSAGGTKADAPAADAGESLWLTYYANTFNPARLKLQMMRREMPTRYWKNLPEAALIDDLSRGAHERSARMVDAAATTPARRIARRP